MMEALELDEEDEIQVKPVSLERAAYLKLLAKDKLFTDIPNPVDVIQDVGYFVKQRTRMNNVIPITGLAQICVPHSRHRNPNFA
jgi:hypothetical protein